MRPIATVFAISLAALSFAAPTAFADGNPQPDGRRKADYAVQKQELLRVREKIQSLQHQIKRGEADVARPNNDTGHEESARHSERMHQLECKIVGAEAQLVELREGRRFTEHHPDVKSAAAVLAGLRRLHQTEVHNANRADAEHRARMQNQHAGGRQQLHALRAQLDRLTAVERNLVASIDYPKPKKVKKAAKLPKRPKPPKPPMTRDDGQRGARAQPGVEDRLARLEKAVKELVHMIKERERVARDRVALERAMVERQAREGRRRGEPARGGRGGEGGGHGGGREVEQREHLMKLRKTLDGERQESEELRKIINQLEQRVHAEREESEELRKMLRRMKAERGERGERQESQELRKIINELEQRVRAEQEESEELRKMLRRMKAERGERGERQESQELRKIINELEQRVRAEQEESEELRNMLRRMKAERGERGKRGDQQRAWEELERALKGARMEAEDLRKNAVHLREKLAKAERADGAARELRGHVRGLERRLEVEKHENAELREMIQELEAEMKAFRKKLERR